MTPSRLFQSFDLSPDGLQRLYGRLLAAVIVPVLLLHTIMMAMGTVSPLVPLLEAACAVIGIRIGLKGIARRVGRPAPVFPVLMAIGLFNIITAFETGGVGSPQIVLVVLTVAFGGLLLDGKALRTLTLILGGTYVLFSCALPDGVTAYYLEGGGFKQLIYWNRLPIATFTALAQNVVYLSLAAYVSHLAKANLGRHWTSMQVQARQDPLTQLPNRLGFQEAVHKALTQEPSFSWPMSLLMLDLDHFKRVNDEFGHATGDEVLKHAARILRDTAGPMDHVARLGGEEFAVAAFAADPEHGADIAGRIVRRFRTYPWSQIEPTLRVTCSIGVSTIPPGGGSAQPGSALSAVMGTADAALYAVKENGRDGYHLIRETPQAKLAPDPVQATVPPPAPLQSMPPAPTAVPGASGAPTSPPQSSVSHGPPLRF